MAKKPVYIYGLFCAASGALRYIGKAKDVRKRFLSHLRETKRRKTPIYFWLAKCIEAGRPPIARVLVVTDEDHWDQCERDVIAFHRESKTNLLNVADGGNMPFQTIEERRQSAKRMNEKVLAKSENQKRISDLKRRLAMMLAMAKKSKDDNMIEHICGAMHRLYAAVPHVCPEWANV